MSKLSSRSAIVGLAALSCIPASIHADTITLRRDNVIPVVFEDKLTLDANRAGDNFTVRVVDDGRLPQGTEMLGRIDKIHPPRGNRPASMDLKFVKLLLPDNSRVNIDAAPIPLGDKYETRTGDGRLVAKQDIRKQQADVLGGAIGGFIIGSIFHRRIAGAVIGTIVGVAAAQSEKAKDNNLIVDQGEKIGALINRDVVLDMRGPFNGPFDGGVDRDLPRPANIPPSSYRVHEGGIGIDRNAPVVIRFKGQDIQMPNDAKPYWIGQTLLVPLEPVADQLGFDVDRRRDRSVYIDSDDQHMRLTEESRHAVLNSNEVMLPRTVVDHGGVLYAPLDTFVLITKDPILVNGTRYGPRT